MKLSDVMGAMGLSMYAEVALVLFFVAFVAVVVWVSARTNQSRWEEARYLPLDDGAALRSDCSEPPRGEHAR